MAIYAATPFARPLGDPPEPEAARLRGVVPAAPLMVRACALAIICSLPTARHRHSIRPLCSAVSRVLSQLGGWFARNAASPPWVVAVVDGAFFVYYPDETIHTRVRCRVVF